MKPEFINLNHSQVKSYFNLKEIITAELIEIWMFSDSSDFSLSDILCSHHNHSQTPTKQYSSLVTPFPPHATFDYPSDPFPYSM